MDSKKKQGRYNRIYNQLKALLVKSNNITSRMCSIASVLHYKMDGFFWTGFYMLADDNNLVVQTYQGPVACMELKKNTGVCWAAINQQKTIMVPNVDKFQGHIACDSRTKSEIVVTVKNKQGKTVGVLDIDSDKLNTFDEVDVAGLEKIVSLIYE